MRYDYKTCLAQENTHLKIRFDQTITNVIKVLLG